MTLTKMSKLVAGIRQRLTPCIECGVLTPYKMTNRVCCECGR